MRAGGVAQLVEYLPSIQETLWVQSLAPNIQAHSCNASTWGGAVDAGRSGVQGNPGLYSRFEANLGYMRNVLAIQLRMNPLGRKKGR